MKIQRKNEPTVVKDYLTPSDSELELNSVTILKEIWENNDRILKNSKRATFFINLIYLLGLITYSFMIYVGTVPYAMASLIYVTIEIFIINLLIFSLTKGAKKQRDNAYNLYMDYEHRRIHGKKTQ